MFLRSAYRQRLTRLKTLLQRIANEDRSGEFTDYYRTIYRLHILRNLPSTAALNTPYRVDFRLTNEFGLFKYEEISQHVGSLPMHMTVLDKHGRVLNASTLEVRVVGEDKYVKQPSEASTRTDQSQLELRSLHEGERAL